MRGATPLVDFGLDLVNNFNPRAPCGARPHPARRCPAQATFQPTRPLRGATPAAGPEGKTMKFQPTRPLRGATRHLSMPWSIRLNFNPRAPCGARRAGTMWRRWRKEFQPTRPLRGATEEFLRVFIVKPISTHAPLAGRDHYASQPPTSMFRFQPTRPLRGATSQR